MILVVVPLVLLEGRVHIDKSLVRIGSGLVSFRFGLIRSVVLVPFPVPLLCRVS